MPSRTTPHTPHTPHHTPPTEHTTPQHNVHSTTHITCAQPCQHTHTHHTTHNTHTTHTTQALNGLCDRFLLRVAMMDESSWQPMSAAQRRRQRRLRSMLRHEQQTVRMALAAALHHSAGPREKVEKQQNGAPRGQKTAARAREEVEHATHYGPRAQETPPPGERPGILAEPGPQRSDRSRRHSSGECLPILGLPVLAGASGEQVDASTLRYLLAHAIEMRKVLEEEEERRKEEEQKKAARSSASSAPKRTRKKRRKRRLPRGVRIRRCGHGVRSRSSLSGACSASWPVCARRTEWLVQGWFYW